MALRFTVQGDTKAETVEGYEWLLSLGLEPRMSPTNTIGNGWMARAVPRPPARFETPAEPSVDA